MRRHLVLGFAPQNFLLARHPTFTESLWRLSLNCFVNSIFTETSNSILRGYTVKSLIMPLKRLYVVQMPQCDLNWIRQLHKQQLKAWLSLFLLITMRHYPAYKASPPQQMSADVHLRWSRLHSKAVSVPPTTQDTLIQGPLWKRPVAFTKTDGNSRVCQGLPRPCVCSSLLFITIYSQMRWYILIGRHKERQRPARDETHHLCVEDKHEASDCHSHPSWFRVRWGPVIASQGSAAEDKWRTAPCWLARSSTSQHIDCYRQKSV